MQRIWPTCARCQRRVAKVVVLDTPIMPGLRVKVWCHGEADEIFIHKEDVMDQTRIAGVAFEAKPPTDAQRCLSDGACFPYDAPDEWFEQSGEPLPPPARDWSHRAARGVLANLSDRRGIKHALSDIDEEVRHDIVDSLAAIILEAHAPTTGASPPVEEKAGPSAMQIIAAVKKQIEAIEAQLRA
jgi:hypothetical protein